MEAASTAALTFLEGLGLARCDLRSGQLERAAARASEATELARKSRYRISRRIGSVLRY